MRLRFGLRSKLLLLSTFLITIPWFGYQYVWEMEKYLRFGQEQTIIGTARALATALHERPNLFNNQASFLPSVEKGKDLYGYQLTQPVNLDGKFKDWPEFAEKAHYYGFDNLLVSQSPLTRESISVQFTAAVGKYDKYVYFFLSIVDDHLIFRDQQALSIDKNDFITVAFTTPDNDFVRLAISNRQSGWLDAFQINHPSGRPTVANYIQGHWQPTNQGYNVEFRLPLSKFSDKLAFAVHDVDKPFGEVLATVASADTSSIDTLGTIVVPSPEIERIVHGMSYTNSSIWVVDQHRRVLAKAGDIRNADGLWQNNRIANQDSDWHQTLKKWLKPLFERLLTAPPKDFVDKLYDAQNLTGEHIQSALNGKPQSQWRLSEDKKAVILTAAYPIYINNKVQGAVIVEETNNGIRTVRNQALEKLFTSILAIMLFGILAFFFFATRISSRIRSLRNQADQAIDEQGRINHLMSASKTNDEIGDLSRSFSTAVSRLSEYNHYLEQMSSRLSHELRTPIAVVRTSLETLSLHCLPEQSDPIIKRAKSGIKRLNLILTNMSEATRLEQMLRDNEKHPFNLVELVKGCVSGYQQVYPDIKFTTDISPEQAQIQGSPEHFVQLLDKVIANAVEFSLDNAIAISLQSKGQHYLLSVSNNGPFLPEEMRERIFDSMVSLRGNQQDMDDKRPHLGLGLYIARLIAEFHQGKMSAINHKNPDGVTISIQLPKA